MSPRPVTPRAREMARAFDQAFASARRPPPPPLANLLGVRIGGDPYAIALGDIDALAPIATLTPLPDAPAACLGIALIRTSATPVYDLRRLLGCPADGGVARWLVLVSGGRAALAFDAIDRRLSAPPEALATAPDTQRAQPHIRGVVDVDGTARAVVDVRSVAEAIQSIAGRRS